MCMRVHMESRRGQRSLAAGIIGGCEPPNMGVGNLNEVLQKRSKCS